MLFWSSYTHGRNRHPKFMVLFIDKSLVIHRPSLWQIWAGLLRLLNRPKRSPSLSRNSIFLHWWVMNVWCSGSLVLDLRNKYQNHSFLIALMCHNLAIIHFHLARRTLRKIITLSNYVMTRLYQSSATSLWIKILKR